jgi:hypothetical protein
MSNSDLLSENFPSGPTAWQELEEKVQQLCSQHDYCSGECPFDRVWVPVSEVLAASPGKKFVKDAELPLCNRFAMFARPEQAAAVVGYQLPSLADDPVAALLDSSISFSDLFPVD